MRVMRWIVGLVAVVALVVTTVVIYGGGSSSGGGDGGDAGGQPRSEDASYEFTVESVPNEVNLVVDGEDVGTTKAGDTQTAETDIVDIEFSREGFESHEASYRLSRDATAEISVALEPITAEARGIVMEETGEFDAEQRGGELYEQDAEEAYEQHPILHDLPQEQHEFAAYQGLSSDDDGEGADFAIHLSLYEGIEDEGREAFEQWLHQSGHAIDDYEVIERDDEEFPPALTDDQPTWEQLEGAAPRQVDNLPELEEAPQTPGQLAENAARVMSTWDTTEDTDLVDSEHRAAQLMSEQLQDTLITPNQPMTTDLWQEAAEGEAVTSPWITTAEARSGEEDGEVTYDLTVCTAWISEVEDPIIDLPRDYQITIDMEEPDEIADFTYLDTVETVDPEETLCDVE